MVESLLSPCLAMSMVKMQDEVLNKSSSLPRINQLLRQGNSPYMKLLRKTSSLQMLITVEKLRPARSAR